MMQNHNRPVFLNLLQIQLPVTGVVSIFHRITGVLWVLLLPVLAYILHRSLENEAGFHWVLSLWDSRAVRMLLLLVVLLLLQHFLSGLRHLLLDLDLGVSRSAARVSAYSCFATTAIAALWLGVCWW